MQSNLIQQLELDILQLKRDMIALDVIADGKPGEFTRAEKNAALARFTAHSGILAMHAMVPGALLMIDDLGYFHKMVDGLREAAVEAARATIKQSEESRHAQG